jgi:hypothetical protein
MVTILGYEGCDKRCYRDMWVGTAQVRNVQGIQDKDNNYSLHLFSPYFKPGTCAKGTLTPSHLSLTSLWGGLCYQLHFIHGKWAACGQSGQTNYAQVPSSSY